MTRDLTHTFARGRKAVARRGQARLGQTFYLEPAAFRSHAPQKGPNPTRRACDALSREEFCAPIPRRRLRRLLCCPRVIIFFCEYAPRGEVLSIPSSLRLRLRLRNAPTAKKITSPPPRGHKPRRDRVATSGKGVCEVACLLQSPRFRVCQPLPITANAHSRSCSARLLRCLRAFWHALPLLSLLLSRLCGERY